MRSFVIWYKDSVNSLEGNNQDKKLDIHINLWSKNPHKLIWSNYTLK